jgi:Protein of unknown function DUF115
MKYIKYIFEKLIKRLSLLKSPILNLLVDSYIDPYHKNDSKNSLMVQTFRYKLAGHELPITKNERKLLCFKNKHFGQRAFLIGNGPSLNLCDLSLLTNEITFGVNSIYMNYDHMGFYPTYYSVEDIFVAEDRSSEINAYHGPVKFFGNYLRYCIEDAEDTIWLNVRMWYDNYKGFPHFSQDASRMVWTGGTVSYINLQLAYFMGFSNVFLIGFDHSYQIPADATIHGAEILSNNDDPNHFHPEYFGKGFRWHDPRVDRMELAYRRAKIIYEAAGRKIFNATVGGKLDVFERVDYGSLF